MSTEHKNQQNSESKQNRIVRKQGSQEYNALKWIQIPLRIQSDETMVESAREERKRRVQEQKDRLLNEITVMEQLKENRNIVRIEDHSVYERPNAEGYDILIRMEYLTPLLAIYPIGPLEQGIVVRMGMDICAALAACESRNRMNIDLKPANVFIDPQGNFKLNDFWITKVLADGEYEPTRSGARSFLPPEIFSGVQKGDQTVDIYALSLMLYRYVNDGHPPFFYETEGAEMTIRNEKAIQRRIQGETVPPARHASAELNRILLKAMAPNPADRYQSAGEMRQDLACLPVTPAEKIQVTPSVPTPKHGAKRKLWMIAVGIALTVGIGFLGFQSGARNGAIGESMPFSMKEDVMQKQQTNDVRQEKTSAPETETDSGINTTPMPSPTPMPTIKPNGLKELVEVCQQNVDLGNTEAMTYLGGLYQSGNGVDQSYEKAAELYKKAADLGNSEAMTSLGLLYKYGNGVSKNVEKAAELFQKAVDLENSDAMTNLGVLYEEGKGVPKSAEKAAELYQKAAELENASAMVNLGCLYEDGTGVPKSIEKAVELYQKAADLGKVSAMYKLGWLYISGNGVPQSYEKAVKLYQKAANLGSASTINNLGWLYGNGKGVPQSVDKAVELYQKAADLGENNAMNSLGELYAIGESVPKSYEKAG